MNFVNILLFSLVLFSFRLIYGDGLPGEYLLSDKWRQVFASQSPVNNPAFIMDEPYLKIRGVLSFSAGDPARIWEIGATLPLNLFNSVGFSILGENGNDVAGTVYRGGNFVDQGVERNNNFLLMGTYAINPWKKISVGTNINLAYQGNFGDPAWGVGVDLGITYHFMIHSDFGSHKLGLSYKNLYSPKVSSYARMPYSAQLKTQYHVSILDNRLFMDCGLSMSDLNSKTAMFVENRKFDWDMEMQFGVNPIPYLKVISFVSITQWKDIGSFGLVFGVDMPNVNKGKELSFLYQFRQNLYSDLMGAHSLYGAAQLGEHREEIYARRLTQIGRYAYNNLYTEAMKNYHKKNYWEAYFSFSRIMMEYPEFFKNDAVSFFAASCLENLDMRSAAVQAYNKVKQRFPNSPYSTKAELGIMRIKYREGKYEEVKAQYKKISESAVDDSIIEQAAYYMGETEVILGNYKQAVTYFQMIKEYSPLYSFSQHSLATTHVFLNSGREQIKYHLLNAINAQKVSGTAQKEIINRSLIFLGYLYYEEKAMAKAVTALRMIPEESYFFEDAQLGLGWAAVKSRQWSDCIEVGKKISIISKKKIIQSEGHLLQAYGYLQQKNYVEAEKYLKYATDFIDKYSTLESDYSRKQNYLQDSTRTIYDSLAKEIIKIAQKPNYQISNKNVDDLHKRQLLLKKNIDSSIRNIDEYKRVRFFEKTFHKLREDLEYALVTVLRLQSDFKKDDIKDNKSEQSIDENKNKKVK